MNKRKLLYSLVRKLQLVMKPSFGNVKKTLLIDCPGGFHYFHILPLLQKLSEDKGIAITVIQWESFCEKPVENIRYISRDIFSREYFKTYDWFLTTEFGLIPWWFKDVVNVFFLHGIGPKVSYFATDKLKEFDLILAPGPFVAKKQEPFLKSGAKIYPVGLPVLDRFFSDDASITPLKSRFNNTKPILLYAPSWSKDCNQISMDSKILQEIIEQDICNVIFRPHPNLFKAELCGGYDWRKKIEDLSREKNNFITYSGEGTSIYDVFTSADFLLSDMSSVLYEFLIFDKPILMYIRKDLGAFYDCETYLVKTQKACHLLSSAAMLKPTLNDCIKHPESLSISRKLLLNESLYYPGGATNKICEVFVHMKGI